MGEINEMILARETQKSGGSDKLEDSDDTGGNSGAMIVDATCAPCKEHGIRLSDPALRRPRKDE